jgi:hypothetical protein
MVGGAIPPGMGMSLLFWHRYFIRYFEDFLGQCEAHHSSPIPYWDSNTHVPHELPTPERYEDAELWPIDSDPAVPLPSWATVEGGAEPAPRPFSRYTSLMQFQSTDELGRSFDLSVFHPSVHQGIMGAMASLDSPSAPIFFPWHGFLDSVWDEWRRGAMPLPVVLIYGQQGSTENVGVKLFTRAKDGELLEGTYSGAGKKWKWAKTGKKIWGRPVLLARGRTDISSLEDMRLHLFAQGADRKLWERYWDGESWTWMDTGISANGEPVTVHGAPTVVAQGNLRSVNLADVRLNVFIRAEDKYVRGDKSHLWWGIRSEDKDGTARWSWYDDLTYPTANPTVPEARNDPGKKIDGDVIALAHGDPDSKEPQDARIRLFARGKDRRLWAGFPKLRPPEEKEKKGVELEAHYDWEYAQLEVSDDPVSVTQGCGASDAQAQATPNLFVRGENGKLWQGRGRFIYKDNNSEPGYKWDWVDTGQGIAGRVVTLTQSDATGQPLVVSSRFLCLQSTSGNLCIARSDGSAWEWSDTGRKIDGEPFVLVQGELSSEGTDFSKIRIHIFARKLAYAPIYGTNDEGEHGYLYPQPHITLLRGYWNGNAWEWTDTKREIAGDPFAFMYGDVANTEPGKVRIHAFVPVAESPSGTHTSHTEHTGHMNNEGSPQTSEHSMTTEPVGMLWEHYWDGALWRWRSTRRRVAV